MPDDPFEAYGEIAKEIADETAVAGRYPFQSRQESAIFQDINSKLGFSPNETCLDIGCGPGNLLIPISFLVDQCVGIDHPAVVERLQKRAPEEDIETIAGNFLNVDVPSKFDKIIVYSVIQNLESEDEVFEFVDKAMSLLEPGGKLLIGDIPNVSKKDRFSKTSLGQSFEEDWEEHVNNTDTSETINGFFPDHYESVEITDEFISNLLIQTRDAEFESYLYPQPSSLPFNYTRDDILIERRPLPSDEP